MTMDFLPLTLPTLEENLALDEALLLEAEANSSNEVLRVWQWPTWAVVVGAGSVIRDDVHVEACQADGVPLARRSSGGGTVLLGPKCLLFSLVLKMEDGSDLTKISGSYQMILGRIAQALAHLQPGSQVAGSSDLVVRGRKFSGNAQQRKRRYLLHHGTLLHGLDLAAMNRYLKHPLRQPEYRVQRSHAEFLTHLPDKPDEIVRSLQRAWQADRVREEWPKPVVADLVAQKYAKPEWLWRR